MNQCVRLNGLQIKIYMIQVNFHRKYLFNVEFNLAEYGRFNLGLKLSAATYEDNINSRVLLWAQDLKPHLSCYSVLQTTALYFFKKIACVCGNISGHILAYVGLLRS